MRIESDLSNTEPIVPEWALGALRPRPDPWPEDSDRLLLVLHGDNGAVGRFGPITAAVRQIVLDQMLPALHGRDMRSWRWLDGVVAAGRHRWGSHYRLAWSAVELAGWDMRASAAGARVVDLLSPDPREQVPVYASMLGFDSDHPEAPRLASWVAKQGYYGQKWQLPALSAAVSPNAALKVATRLRAAVGDTRLMIDAQGQWDAVACRQLLPGLAALDVEWVEEPSARSKHGYPPQMSEVHRGLLAAGEHAYELEEQLVLVTHSSIGVMQPDIGWQGGLYQALVLTNVARALGKSVLPHGGSFLPGLLLGAACLDAVPAVEYHVSLEPRRQAIYTAPIRPAAGHAMIPISRGLGVDYRC